VKPYVRGNNFAIRATSYAKSGGMGQPLSTEGYPLPGEDVELEHSILKIGGNFAGVLETVYPSPRRYIDNMTNLDKFTGRVHMGNSVSEVRREKVLLEKFKQIPSEVSKKYCNMIIQKLFESLVKVYLDEIYESTDFKRNIIGILAPFSAEEISEDFKNDNLQVVWDKYKKIFLSNCKERIKTF
jgi:hypothetical protein